MFCLEALFSLGPEELGSFEDKDKPDAKVLNLRFTRSFWGGIEEMCFFLRKELSSLIIEIHNFINYRILIFIFKKSHGLYTD